MCSLLLVVMAVVVLVVQSVSPGVFPSAHHQADDQKEVLSAIATSLNQMALHREMNKSSSICASRDNELRELRLLREATMKQLEEMKQEAKKEMDAVREAMETEVKDLVLEAVRNASLVQPSQQPSLQPSHQPDPSDINALHNDTIPSLCGPHKVLVGGRGSVSPSYPRWYRENMYCTWEVILPVGTRPVFTWEYIQMEECGNCRCDWVAVPVPGVADLTKMCGNLSVADNPSMNSIMENRFTVIFKSDGRYGGAGFVLRYAAEPIP